MDSFRGIYDECQTIVANLRDRLYAALEEPDVPQRRLIEQYELLRKLDRGVDTAQLCRDVLERAARQVMTDRKMQKTEYETQ